MEGRGGNFNNFAGKAIVPVAITMTGFVIVCSILLYSFIKKDLVRDTIHHEASLADTIIKATRYAMLKSDREMISQIVRHIGQQEDVEHVRIFSGEGLIFFSSSAEELNKIIDKKDPGCIGCHGGSQPTATLGSMEKARRYTNDRNQRIIAIMAPINNEPECYSNACHYHPADKKILGILDIGLSQGTLVQTLGTLRLRMIIFCLMILVLSVGGVSALLRVNVLTPIRKLMDYVEGLSLGRLDRPIPKGVEEVETISRTCLEMAHQKKVAEEELEKYRSKGGNIES
jgi:HAMP domain-containing protein/Zn finger protein HypA/HybF involved in hydrogenase expression